MSGKKVGYVRVSSTGQNTERQLDGLKLDKIFTEKASAATTKRPELKRCLEYLREDDELYVHSIDRLARNLQDLLEIVTSLKEKGIPVHFVKEQLDFGSGNNAMSDLMLQIFGAVAQFERSLIRERQQEGIAKAHKKGVKFGVKPKLTPGQIEEVKQMIKDRYKKTDIAKKFGVSVQTIYNYLGTDQKKQA
jgi:DNA invertase Pin-like site-specific DNA recombinase